ncbi:hypothetical protein GIB67_017699 [Kingdonia uniflora]|uniref:Sugar phosphate transporter domain-containing protein n=1 Tax=Kingdonia uniflora TaxID=39325 RepID=A0A7J7NAD4_9MAGN|nr:hypothetical protein GIB67_017699 [Kingdonia uniflora]
MKIHNLMKRTPFSHDVQEEESGVRTRVQEPPKIMRQTNDVTRVAVPEVTTNLRVVRGAKQPLDLHSSVNQQQQRVDHAVEMAKRVETEFKLAGNSTTSGPTTYPTMLSYMILQRVSPVTHSVANCVKRVAVIVASVLFFKTHVSAANSIGTGVALAGVFLYSRVNGIKSKPKENMNGSYSKTD